MDFFQLISVVRRMGHILYKPGRQLPHHFLQELPSQAALLLHIPILRVITFQHFRVYRLPLLCLAAPPLALLAFVVIAIQRGLPNGPDLSA